MKNDNTSIHQFQLDLICEYFSNLERQGPGDPEITIKALGFIESLVEDSRIADLGCGTGGQTMVLASNVKGKITGIDLFPTFIEIFNKNARKFNLEGRVEGVVGSMDNLPFEKGELDLIWSEGAIYNIGFERGLKEWREYLKTGGYVAVSEASWFTEERPKEVEYFWMEAYTEIDTIPKKVEQMSNAGYIPVATFILPEKCWTENFFAPQESVINNFLKKYSGNKTVEDFIDYMKYESLLYEKYKEYYGYVFYIGKKI
jgi:SAM-dependent methyltransferase